jgi:hypothetical protein
MEDTATNESEAREVTLSLIAEEEGLEGSIQHLLDYCDARTEETIKEHPTIAERYQRTKRMLFNAQRMSIMWSL